MGNQGNLKSWGNKNGYTIAVTNIHSPTLPYQPQAWIDLGKFNINCKSTTNLATNYAIVWNQSMAIIHNEDVAEYKER